MARAIALTRGTSVPRVDARLCWKIGKGPETRAQLENARVSGLNRDVAPAGAPWPVLTPNQLTAGRLQPP